MSSGWIWFCCMLITVINTFVFCRFMVECRYSETGDAKQSLATVGYMVKTPASTLPTSVISNGLYSVELRLAEGWVFCNKYNEQFLLSTCKLSSVSICCFSVLPQQIRRIQNTWPLPLCPCDCSLANRCILSCA